MQDNTAQVAASREKTIVRTSFIGIGANLLLAAFKAAVGLLSHSIAVILDAVNNLSDALSSVITIIGTKLSGKAPDKKHPLGYGRIEYLTAMIVSAIVLYAGVTSLVESVRKIIHPETPDYAAVSLVIIAAAVLVKALLGRYVKGVGEKVNSGSLVASGSDAMSDAILSASVLACALLYKLTGVSLEAWVGVVIAGFIIKAGIEMMLDTLNEILGSRPEKEFSDAIRATICEEDAVQGAFDLYLYNYGPDRNYGSVHVELDDTLTAREIDVLERRIQARVYARHGVILTGIGLYAVDTGDAAMDMRRRAMEAVLAHDYAMQFHGFYLDQERKCVTFDVVFSFDCDRNEAMAELTREVSALFPGYKVIIQPDVDVADLH